MVKAAAAQSRDATSLDEFIDWIASRYVQRSTIYRTTALQFARCNFEKYGAMDGIEFGDPDYAWNLDGAWALADEDMECWEE